MSRRRVAEVSEGEEFGPLVVSVDRERLVAYAAASGDHNRIHWDEEVARSVGLPGVIAHGMWTMGAAVQVVSQWAGDPTAVVSYRTKFTAPVVVPARGAVTIEARGRVRSVATDGPGGPRATVALTVTADGEQVLNRAEAIVLLGSEGDPAAPAPTKDGGDGDA